VLWQRLFPTCAVNAVVMRPAKQLSPLEVARSVRVR